MNKAELIEAIAASADVPKTVAQRALDATLEAVKGALSVGEPVTLVGFGTFSVSHRAPRAGHNPATGGAIEIPARNVPVFKAGKGLKDAVN